MTKESYNPFKMWGSWIGVIVVIFLLTVDKFFRSVMGFVNLTIDPSNLPTRSLLFILVLMVSGFLIGWGIHSLIRRLT